MKIQRENALLRWLAPLNCYYLDCIFFSFYVFYMLCSGIKVRYHLFFGKLKIKKSTRQKNCL